MSGYMDTDDSTTLINLRVMSKLYSGDRLHVADTRYFGIDQGIWASFSRWMRYDNRHRTLDRVEATLRHASTMKNANIKSVVDQAKQGLRELAKTYAQDHSTVARIEVLADMGDGEQAF